MKIQKKVIWILAACVLLLIISIYNYSRNGTKIHQRKDMAVENPINLHPINSLVDGPGRYDKWTVETTDNEWKINETQFCFLTGQKQSMNSNTRFITVKLGMGRLGNRLFQVASLVGIAKLNGFVPILHKEFSLFKYYNLRGSDNCNISLQNVEVFTEIAPLKYDDRVRNLSSSNNWSLDGFYQSWKYIQNVESVHSLFELKKEYKHEQFMKFMKNIHKSKAVKVCIHARRGDFMTDWYISHGYGAPPVSYFNKSMNYFINKFEKLQFIFLSNGIDWCKDNFGDRDNVYFSPFTEAILDMEVMKSCDHMVTSMGSFGWWGGWLAGGTVIYYKRFPIPGTWLDERFNKIDYFPKGWIEMDA